MDFRKNLPLKSYGVKKPIANELELPASRFRALSGPTKAGTTRRVTGQSRVASPATYRCKWPKTTEILGLHKSVYFPESDYYTRMRTNDVSIVLQFVCIGFCTLVSSSFIAVDNHVFYVWLRMRVADMLKQQHLLSSKVALT